MTLKGLGLRESLGINMSRHDESPDVGWTECFICQSELFTEDENAIYAWGEIVCSKYCLEELEIVVMKEEEQ